MIIVTIEVPDSASRELFGALDDALQHAVERASRCAQLDVDPKTRRYAWMDVAAGLFAALKPGRTP